jgi:hypothetical protein
LLASKIINLASKVLCFGIVPSPRHAANDARVSWPWPFQGKLPSKTQTHS